jgi:alpha-tubulin suppressor-like RCC1 family protein
MKNKKFRIFSKQLNFKKLLFVVMVAGLAIIGVQNYTDNSSKAAGWTFDSIQGNRIDSTNNPGGYLNNAPSISPDNGTNFSPAFGNSVGSAVTINGSGFPTPDFNINAKEVQSGEGYSCYLSNVPDSWLYCWGKNDVGYLGDGTNIHRASPVPISRGQISQNETITTFALGYRHACVVTDLNKTYCWGVNLYGALGIGTASGNYNTPQLVQAGDLPSGDYFKSINLGFLYSCAISNEDEAYCWGWNDVGQLGLGFTYPTAVHTPRKVKTISDEASYVMPNAVKQISASYQSTCAVANDDSVYCWGSNNYGQLGDNTTDNKSAPVKVYGMSGVAFAKVETGGDFTCALNNNNQIYCWGHNSYGQLGNGTNNNSSVPIAVVGGIAFKEIGSSEHTGIFGTICAISVIDEPYCWGSLYTGSGLWSDASSPTKVKTTSGGGTMPDTVISISTSTGSGSSDGCAVATDSKVYCWGYGYPNTYFVLGNNSYNDSREPIPVVQFGEVPKIYFDDIYGLECQSVIVISPSQLRCIIVVGLAQGLHDVVVGYNGENKTLPQSYMYKTIPNAPTGVTAVGKNKIVHLEWQWQDEKPYIDSASFYIECKRSDAAVWRDVSVYGCDTGKQGMPSLLAKSTNSGTADIYGLENGVVYDFRIRSYANSTYSDYVFLYNQVPQASIYVPSQPIIASSTASGTNATINWQAPASDGGSPVTGYMVMAQCAAYSSGGTMVQTAMQTYQVSTTSLTISSCLNAVNPTKISVIASNANGASEPSGAVELWATAALKPPSIPSNIKVNNVNTDQTMLSWTAPSNNGSAITQYEVRYSILPDFSDWTGTVGVDTCVSSTPAPPTTSCVSNSLTLGSQYYFQVRATNANGASDWSVIHASVVGAPDRPIISTISTTTINSATSSIYLAWNAPNDNGAAITNYRLE